MKLGEYIRLMFSTDGKAPSWFRVMATPIILGAAFVFTWSAIKGDAAIAGISAGVITTVMSLKALQKRSEKDG